ncbi:MAG: amidase [Acidobacteriia bacterium]|nr:amidase [Terriglobia bacterium]
MSIVFEKVWNPNSLESDFMKSPSALSASSLCLLPALEIAQLVNSKEVSAVEVMYEHAERIQRLNPALNAFAHLDLERAFEEARRIDSGCIHGSAEGVLLGVPVTIKSCIDVEGLRCAVGSRLRSDYVPASSATLVTRLKRAGAIVIGNTTTPEMLMAYHTENEIHGRTNNPWDLSRTPGGSSGGEAAAISSCMSAGGFGSDGGGSIRVPAHFTGICGLKPTPGLIPADGHYPACAGPFSLIGVVGPMARTVKDLQLLFAVTAGCESADPGAVPAPGKAQDSGRMKQLRIGYYEDDGESGSDCKTAEVVRSAASALRNAGFVVEPFRPKGLARARELWAVIFVEAGALLLGAMAQGQENDVTRNTREFIALAAARPVLTGERLLNTLIECDQLRLSIQEQMRDYPILLAPICSMPAFLHQDAGWGPEHAADYLRTMSYCQHYNLLGNPAATVPVGQSAEGLPIGVQIIGRPYKDHEVLAVANILNQQYKWREPPLCRAND